MTKAIVILTGAGISAESGVRTFRDHNGLWENHRIEDVATPEGFQRNPLLVHSFYNARRLQLCDPSVAANAAHFALARLEHAWHGDFLLVTQNVDDLHERAGSKRLLHMHGELQKIRCETCEAVSVHLDDLSVDHACRSCGTKSLRPHIVWFGEMPLFMDEIYDALKKCDLFISIGTSGLVYPAAGFVRAVAPSTRTIEINLEATNIADDFKEHRTGPATREVTQLVNELLA